MARWDEKRGCFRVVIETPQPGGKRKRRYRDIQAPNTRAGRKAAEFAEAELRVEAARAAETEWPGQTGGVNTFGSYAAAWLDRKRGRGPQKRSRRPRATCAARSSRPWETHRSTA